MEDSALVGTHVVRLPGGLDLEAEGAFRFAVRARARIGDVRTEELRLHLVCDGLGSGESRGVAGHDLHVAGGIAGLSLGLWALLNDDGPDRMVAPWFARNFS